MGFIKMVIRPPRHQCTVPPRANFGKGTVWECAECNQRWEVRTFSDSPRPTDWRREGRGGFLHMIRSNRIPALRAPEPSTFDLERELKMLTILEELNIDPSVLGVVTLENSAARAPYHGYQHLLTVAINAYQGAHYHQLSAEDTRILVIAAIFHDYGHPAARKIVAQESKGAALDGFDAHQCSLNLHLSPEQADDVRAMIAATSYPYQPTGCIKAQILQDANLMQVLERDGYRFVAALAEEMGAPIDFEDMEVFLSRVPLATAWGRNRFDPLGIRT